MGMVREREWLKNKKERGYKNNFKEFWNKLSVVFSAVLEHVPLLYM